MMPAGEGKESSLPGRAEKPLLQCSAISYRSTTIGINCSFNTDRFLSDNPREGPVRKISAIVAMVLFPLFSINLYAGEKDAAGCRDNPLAPRMPGYYIAECNESFANSDMDITDGKPNETVHIEGKSLGWAFRPQPDLASKPSELQIRGAFADAMKKQGGTLVGTTLNKWPIYRLNKDGKEFWAVLMVNSGEYYTGMYTCRVIEKGEKAKEAPKPVKTIDCKDYEFKYPLSTRMPGYEICGCGGFEAPDIHEIKIVEGKNPGTIHVEGKYRSVTYCPQEGLKAKPGVLQIRRHFKAVLKKQGGIFMGTTDDYGDKKDVYKLVKDGGEFWVEVWPERTGEGMYTYGVTRKGTPGQK
jgi:hypothetical protein